MEIEVTDDIRVAPESKNMIRILSEAFEKRTPIDINAKQYMVVAKSNSVFSMRRVESVKAAEWTGEGLPPVGTVCEFMKHNSPPAPEGKWTVGDIRYVSDCTVIIGGDGCEHVHHPRNCSFRPARTPEQIAAEEHRAKYMPKLAKLWDADTSRDEFLEAVYSMISGAHSKQVNP